MSAMGREQTVTQGWLAEVSKPLGSVKNVRHIWCMHV